MEQEARVQSEAATFDEWQQEQKVFDNRMMDSRGDALVRCDRLGAKLSLAERRHMEATENMEMKQHRWQREVEEERRLKHKRDEEGQRARLQSAIKLTE
eukprot:3784245-Prorocentrum_lima.AAC.1